ncbi:MAG TPA: four helix bundle protein [Acidobacteriaceae bacterium]|nr:four helix bundle protein [Acidobacteriaceae bacterium]
MKGQKQTPLYRDSTTWQRSMELAAQIYRTTARFPNDERFGLTNQLRRCAVSIPSNIAEGKGRLTKGELMHFLGIARGSALELQTQLELALMLNMGDSRQIEAADSLACEVVKMLNASLTTMRERKAQ